MLTLELSEKCLLGIGVRSPDIVCLVAVCLPIGEQPRTLLNRDAHLKPFNPLANQ